MSDMQQITSPQDVRRLGTVMVVCAHPDDETFCAGGLMAAAVRNGQKVICITATKGEAGLQDPSRWSRDTLGDTRTKELAAAFKVLGITNHHWLEYEDGGCSKVDSSKAATEVRRFIEQYKPDSVLTFGPEGVTGHPDHQAVSAWVSLALQQTDLNIELYHAVLTLAQYTNYLQLADQKLNMFYNIDQPPLVDEADCDICFCCTSELCDCKQSAFQAMPSQFNRMINTLGKEFMSEAFRVEAFVKVEADSTET